MPVLAVESTLCKEGKGFRFEMVSRKSRQKWEIQTSVWMFRLLLAGIVII